MDPYGSGCHRSPPATCSEIGRPRPRARGSADRRSRSALATRAQSDRGEQQGGERAARRGAIATGNRACGFQSRSWADRGLTDARHRASEPHGAVLVRRAVTAAVRRAFPDGLAYALAAAPTVAIGARRTLRGRAGAAKADKAGDTDLPGVTTQAEALVLHACLAVVALFRANFAFTQLLAGLVTRELAGAGRASQRDDQREDHPGGPVLPSPPLQRSRLHAEYLAGPFTLHGRFRGRGMLYAPSLVTSVRRDRPSRSAACVWFPAHCSRASRMR